MSDQRKVAFITGASRGIGRAAAVTMAETGFDVVITARTVKQGQRHEHMLSTADGRPLPGSLEETEKLVRGQGREALVLPIDLLDTASIDMAVDSVIAEWGRVDVLVNNATFQGSGINVPFEELELGDLRRVFEANVLAPFHLTKRVVELMLRFGGGVIISLTTGGAEHDPPMPVWKGSWGFGYGASKAAFHRLAGILNMELGGKGIRAYNLNPGVVTTEALLATLGGDSDMAASYGSAPPEVPAAVIRWLATEPEASEYLGKTVHAQSVCRKRGLVTGWPPEQS
ncbi:MAG: SDR family oxidoreductase [Dehalococcoidia bacterium]